MVAFAFFALPLMLEDAAPQQDASATSVVAVLQKVPLPKRIDVSKKLLQEYVGFDDQASH